MLSWIVTTSLRFRYLVVGLAAVLMIYGITQIGQMPVDVFPEFAPPKSRFRLAVSDFRRSKWRN